MPHPQSSDFNPIRDLSREDYYAMMEYRGYAKCSNCWAEVPEETVRRDPIYYDARVCEECLKNIREEIDLNRKTPKEL